MSKWKKWHKVTLGSIGGLMFGCVGIGIVGAALTPPTTTPTPVASAEMQGLLPKPIDSPIVAASTVDNPTPEKTATTTKTKTVTKSTPKPTPKKTVVYYADCDAVRAAGAAPLYKGQPGYRSGLDRDGDGVACEKK